jgi:hypothetical protein
MQDLFSITLPDTASEKDIEALQDTLKTLDTVADAGADPDRGVDPASIMVWVQVVSGVLGAVSTAVPIVKKVIETIRGKGISGAKIKLPNGVEVAVDNASADEIERLLQAVGEK